MVVGNSLCTELLTFQDNVKEIISTCLKSGLVDLVVSIMVYGSMPYIQGWPQNKITATLKVHK